MFALDDIYIRYVSNVYGFLLGDESQLMTEVMQKSVMVACSCW